MFSYYLTLTIGLMKEKTKLNIDYYILNVILLINLYLLCLSISEDDILFIILIILNGFYIVYELFYCVKKMEEITYYE